MSINISELIWTVICFFVLLFVLKALLFNPIIRFMDDRKARIDDSLTENRRAQQAREANAAEQSAVLRARSAEASRILAEAKEADEKARADLLVSTHETAAQTLREARTRIHEEEADARAAVESRLPELVAELTGTLLGRDAVAGQDEAIRRYVAAAGEP